MPFLKNSCFVFLFTIAIKVVAQTPELVLQQGHLSAINSISFSKDGRYILSTSSDQSAKIWDPFNGKIITQLKGSDAPLSNISFFAPEDKFVMTSSNDSSANEEGGIRTFFFWDPHTGKLLYTKKNWDIRISPSGKFLAFFNQDDQRIDICFSENGKRYNLIKGKSNMGVAPTYVEFISDSVLMIGDYNNVNNDDGKRYLLISSINIKTNSIIYSFKIPDLNESIVHLSKSKISHSGKYFLCKSGGEYNSVESWDLAQKKLLWKKNMELLQVDFSPDDSKLILNYLPSYKPKKSNDIMTVLNLLKEAKIDQREKIGEITDEDMHDPEMIRYAQSLAEGNLMEISVSDTTQYRKLKNQGIYCYSPKGNYIATSYRDPGIAFNPKKDHYSSKVGIWNTANKLVSECSINNELTSISFSNDEKYFLTGFKDGNFAVWDISKPVAERITLIKNEFDPIIRINLDSLNKMAIKTNAIYAIHETNTINKVSVSSALKNMKPEKTQTKITSPDGKTHCSIASNNIIVQKVNVKKADTLIGHSSKVLGVQYTSDSKYIYSWSRDGSYKKWDIKIGKLIYTFLFFLDHDYAIILPEGYYYVSSKTDAKYLTFKLNGRLYNFSQFDLQYNRPDKVLQAMGSTDKDLIDEYHKTWLKRLEKSNFNESALNNKELHVPAVSIRQDFDHVSKKDEIEIHFSLYDSLYKIDRYNIFVNDVPLNGINGRKISAPTNHVNDSQKIILSEGENKIEINCTNEKVAESRKEVIYINYKPDQPIISKTYFIGIGINEYSQYSSFKNLAYCVKDIRDLTAAFKEKYRDELVVDTLMDYNASKENILAFRQKLLHTNVEDRVIISFSGHGITDINDHDRFYFVTGKTDIRNPSINGVSYEELEELLDSIPARKKLMLLDACHSGESDEDQITKVQNVNTGTKKGNDDYNTTNESSVQIMEVNMKGPAHASSTDIFKLMKEAFVDIRRNNGAYVISAAQSNETAEENKNISNGIFTHCLLSQIKSTSSLKINELSININKCVSESTNGVQNTANRQELAEFNWQIW